MNLLRRRCFAVLSAAPFFPMVSPALAVQPEVTDPEKYKAMMAERGWIERKCNASYVNWRHSTLTSSTHCALQYGHAGPHKDLGGGWR